MSKRWLRLLAIVVVLGVVSPLSAFAQSSERDPIRKSLRFAGEEREYFVRLPRDFASAKQYWLLVVIHGGGGNGRTFFMASGIRDAADELGLKAIVVSPSFPTDENLTSRFPVLGQGDFLQQVLDDVRGQYRLYPRILLAGYSRGGQFTHRFTFRNPALVEAAAPLAAGSWTTPDGRLLLESFGEVKDPKAFLTSAENAPKIPGRLRDLFDPRVANAAGLPALGGVERIPFLVMCGTLDPRLSIAEEFVASLRAVGYTVETEWPRSPHGCRDAGCRAEFRSEFEKYSWRAAEFFLQVTQGN